MPVGLALAVSMSLASRCWRSAAVWTVGSVVWAKAGDAVRSARDRTVRRSILTPGRLGGQIIVAVGMVEGSVFGENVEEDGADSGMNFLEERSRFLRCAAE